MRAKTAVAAALALLTVGGVVVGLAYGKAGELPALRELVGHSARGRPIYAYLLGPPGGRPVLVVGCTHGDESAGMAIVSALRELEPPVGVDLWLIPTINPDGVAAGTTGNAHGVNLNRNFPYAWRHLHGTGHLNSGPRPLSEPETRALHTFLLRLKPRLAIWFHQPLAVVDDSQGSRSLEGTFGRLVGLPVRPLTDYPGSITNWENHRFPGSTAFVTELPRGSLSRVRAFRYARAIVAIARSEEARAASSPGRVDSPQRSRRRQGKMVTGRLAGGIEHPSVLIADDDIPHRRAVREALEADGFVVVGEASDAAAAIGAATRLQPDICLIEIELPLEGLNAIGRINKVSPETMVVVLSRSDHSEDVVTAFARGASGYLLKGISGERLAAALRGAYNGEPPVSRSLVPYLVDEIRRGSVRRLSLPTGPVMLTPREWEVGQLLREGRSTTEIAETLGVSPITVRRHVGLLLKKLGTKDRSAAVELLRVYGRR